MYTLYIKNFTSATSVCEEEISKRRCPMAVGETRTVRLPQYLDALAVVPGVTDQDIARIQKEFSDRFSVLPERVTFHRGDAWHQYGGANNGNIHIHRIFTSTGSSSPQDFTLTPEGWDSSFGGSTGASRIAFGYFVGGVFGEAQEAGAQMTFQLYKCSQSGKSLDECLERPRIHQLQRVLSEEQQRKREMEELRTRVEAAERGAQALIQLNAEADELWRKADKMREDAKGWGDGDHDGIADIMARYEDSRLPSQDVTSAGMRNQSAQNMLREIATNDGGWPQFKEKFCRQGRLIQQGSCEDIYELECEFGVRSSATMSVYKNCHNGRESFGADGKGDKGDREKPSGHDCNRGGKTREYSGGKW